MGNWTRRAQGRHKGRVLELFLVLLMLAGVDPARASTVRNVVVTATTIRIDFSAPVGEAERFVLAGPDRIALDIAGATQGDAVVVAGGPVQRMRQGSAGAGALRLVFDLVNPATVTTAGFAADGRSLTLGLRIASTAEFAAAARASRMAITSPLGGMPTLAAARRDQRRYQVSVPIGRPRNGIALPPIAGPNDGSLPLVVIDAGHGGHDPGALAPDGVRREEDITLALARATRAALVATGRVRVALTRDDDRFLVLEERYGIARRLGADLFISIHADAAENREARGASIYTLSEVASDREAARLAARENRANILAGVDLGGQSADVAQILIDLTQRETMNLSADFARTLQRVGADSIPFRSSALRHAGFVVLKAPDLPSILFEAGFITNSDDADRLASTAGQQTIARAFRDSVLQHFARRLALRDAAVTQLAAR